MASPQKKGAAMTSEKNANVENAFVPSYYADSFTETVLDRSGMAVEVGQTCYIAEPTSMSYGRRGRVTEVLPGKRVTVETKDGQCTLPARGITRFGLRMEDAMELIQILLDARVERAKATVIA